jgi:enhancing lycopene biosynthesis protein 2
MKKVVVVLSGCGFLDGVEINEMGAHHQYCTVNNIVIDERKKVVSTPAYMLAQRISDAAEGIENLLSGYLACVHN